MSVMTDVHRKAMDLAAKGLVARMRGDTEEAAAHFEQALENELVALNELDRLGDKVEPTHSVLHRSAATLALDCRDFRLAEKLASKALAADPPPAIADELRNVLEQANSYRHLELKGVKLEPDEMQVSLAGTEVGWGFVGFNEFKVRVENALSLLGRIVERRAGKPYRDRGRVSADIDERYRTYISAPRAGSFAVSVKLSSPIEQLSFPETLDTPEIVDEFMHLVELVNDSQLEAIQERIPDPAYQRNFLALAKKIAPDGERISQVGFTVVRPGEQRSVAFTRPAADIKPVSFTQKPEPDSAIPQPLVGVLLGADATRADGDRIKIVDDDRKTHELRVREGLGDIVRPMWDTRVAVTWSHEGDSVFLEDIDPMEPS